MAKGQRTCGGLMGLALCLLFFPVSCGNKPSATVNEDVPAVSAGPNTNDWSWGSWVQGYIDYYIGDATIVMSSIDFRDPTKKSFEYDYAISSVTATEIRADMTNYIEGWNLPDEDIHLVLTKIPGAAGAAPRLSRTVKGLPRYLVRTAGRDSGLSAKVESVTGKALRALGLGGAAFVSVTLQNVVNKLDKQTVQTDASGMIAPVSVKVIASDSYIMSVPAATSTAQSAAVTVTPQNNGDDMGVIVLPPPDIRYNLKATWKPTPNLIGVAAPFFYSNGAKYQITLSIGSVGAEATPGGLTYHIAEANGSSLAVLDSNGSLYGTNGFLNHGMSVPVGAVEDVLLQVSLAAPPDPTKEYCDQKIEVTYYSGAIEAANELWTDSVSLRFYRMAAIFTVRNNGGAASGILITPEGKAAKIMGGTVKGVSYPSWPVVVPWLSGSYLIGMAANDYASTFAVPTYGYSVGVNAEAPTPPSTETQDAADAPDSAEVLGNYSTFTGYISSVSDADYFKVDLSTTSTGSPAPPPGITVALDSIQISSDQGKTWSLFWSALDKPLTEPVLYGAAPYRFSFAITNNSPDYLVEVGVDMGTTYGSALLWRPYTGDGFHIPAGTSATLVNKTGNAPLRLDLAQGASTLTFAFTASGPDIAYSTGNIYRYSLSIPVK